MLLLGSERNRTLVAAMGDGGGDAIGDFIF